MMDHRWTSKLTAGDGITMTNAADGSSLILWRRSSFCANGDCLEVAEQDRMILIRDSKNPGQTPIRITRAELAAFADGIKAGELDDLCETR
jgi:hypothetical protein